MIALNYIFSFLERQLEIVERVILEQRKEGERGCGIGWGLHGKLEVDNMGLWKCEKSELCLSCL